MPLPNEADRVVVQALTPRERDVVACLAAGATTNRQLAAGLSVAESTIHYHLASIMRKFGLCNRTQIIIHAYMAGLIENSETDAPSWPLRA